MLPRSLLLVTLLAVLAKAEDRPSMRQLPPSGPLPGPPSLRDLVDARAAVKARFKDPLSHTATAAGARSAADALIAGAREESDLARKWMMLDEARRLGASAGSAEIVARAITLTAAVFDVDELAIALESLEEIPLRALDPGRASRLAEAAERIAAQAETDGRDDVAADARMLAFRAWQRAGNTAAARRLAR